MRDLSALLAPASIAVVGASEKSTSFGGQVLKNLVDFGYAGGLYAVHPKATSVFAQPCYASLSQLPTTPDCVALAVANHQLIALLEEAAEIGVRGAIVFGDPNVGAGRAPGLQAEIASLCERHDINVCGPNAMGLYALHHRLVISGYPVDPNLPRGCVALLTHSGTVFDALSQNNRGVGFNYVIAGGNEASVTVSDYLHFVLDDPSTKAVALYLETVREPASFVAALQRAERKRIPIIVLKVGLSEIGKVMTQAHTGALAGGGETYAALFSHYGAQQVNTLDELMDCIELFSALDKPPARRLSVLMESGGERSLVADLIQGLAVEFTELSATTNQKMSAVLDDGVHPDNPLDAFGTGHDVVGVYSKCLSVMGDDPMTDILVLAVDLVRDSYLSPQYVQAVLSVLPELSKPVVVMVNLTAGANTRLMTQLRSNSVPVLMGTATGLRALHHLSSFYEHSPAVEENLLRPAQTVVTAWRRHLSDTDGPLDEFTSKKLLADYGMTTTAEAIATTITQATEAAAQIGYPVAVKTAAPGLLHKSDVGGIFLHLPNATQLGIAYKELSARLGPQVIVQEMADSGTEMILGMHRDPQFGPVLLVGFGGIFVEVLRDSVNFLGPLNLRRARSLLQQLRGYTVLEGVRGKQGADLDALCEQLVRFAAFVDDFGELLEAVDVNPLIAQARGSRIVDAVIIPRRTQR